MKSGIKQVGFAVFFLLVIALVVVEAAEASPGGVVQADAADALPQAR